MKKMKQWLTVAAVVALCGTMMTVCKDKGSAQLPVNGTMEEALAQGETPKAVVDLMKRVNLDDRYETVMEDKATGEGWKEAPEGELAFVLGQEKMPNGQEGNVPVLFNGAVTGGSIRDPWGHAFRYKIMSTALTTEDDHDGDQGEAAFAIPNINRIPADEVN